MSEPRDRLAAAQADLLRAVLADGPIPSGFDERAVRVEAAALLAKRRRVVARLIPETAGDLGDRYRPLFDEYARIHPRLEGTRYRDDAAQFEQWATAQGMLAAPKRRWWRRG
ncbi:Uncharacterized protein conserved in bacteria, NMA0228-like [Alloactinosynnema sp. L-07]|uniref:hypothetical protein n=1 Tax=Alloactinosynnema sp. L-07 TaxID=1653480 RepID=UPI00065EFCBC|nr:hypothetical protein [Alloactinosynnema sp. L-07]CRK55892.1 Uncharacterized protein conserved in bacteria, NMA0228-like [Alloactinosynnema sp. L-07]